jgi:hypothetical protein
MPSPEVSASTITAMAIALAGTVSRLRHIHARQPVDHHRQDRIPFCPTPAVVHVVTDHPRSPPSPALPRVLDVATRV